jgi:3-deoxy-manno-octulosonate cytidylyltransferase (CMP-KDO synthetase)
MIQWVYERVSSLNIIDSVYVATDDERIFNAVYQFGGKALMTGECSCGTERVFQASKDIESDIVLNVQGDEPLIDPRMLGDLITAFDDEDVLMATLKKKITNYDEIDNTNVVKVITDNYENAIYFSRFSIPYNRDGLAIEYYKHIGVYGYRKSFLEEFVSLPKGKLEVIENLEQLRAIENGYKIRVKETGYQSIGVDVPEDIERVVAQLNMWNQ